MLNSNKGQILLALKDFVKDVQPLALEDREVEVRESWLTATGDPYRGASIIDLGEDYADGTINTQDVRYLCGIFLASHRTADAVLTSDPVQTWYERIRRRLNGERLSVTITNATDPREHVCIVLPAKVLDNPAKYPNYLIRQLIVAVWLRELPINPQ